jgi:dihydroorotase
MSRILLKDVKIVDPQSEWNGQRVQVLIEEGIIQRIRESRQETADDSLQVIEAEDLHASPGWIDMHVQLADPGFEWKESLEEMATAAVRGGFTSVLGYPNTQPVLDNSHLIKSLQMRAAPLPIDLLLAGSMTVGAQGKEMSEMYDMQVAGAVAFTDGNHPLQHGGLLMRALLYTQSFNGLLIQYPTDNHLVGEGQMHEGIVSANLGMKGIPAIAEGLGTVRDLGIQSYAGGRMHFHPVTEPQSLQAIAQASQNDERISLGTNIAYLVARDENLLDYDTNYKVMPPFRSEAEIEALQKAIADGSIQVLASGHSAQSTEEKKLQFEQAEPGILGLQTAFALAHEYLVDTDLISLERLVELISINPRRLLGLEAVSITQGQKANLSLFCPQEPWQLQVGDIPSRSKNSPFLGKELKGKVKGIVHKGQFHAS